MQKRLTALILCLMMHFSVIYTFCSDINDTPVKEKTESGTINIMEAMEEFSNLVVRFNNAETNDEKKEIFAEAKAINDAFFGDSDVYFDGYQSMLIEIERIEAEESTLSSIAWKLSGYTTFTSVGGGMTVNGVEQIPDKKVLTDAERLEIISLLEKSLVSGCIKNSDATDKSYFLNAARGVYAIRGEGELGERIEELYNDIINHPLLKSDEDIISDSAITFSDVSESDWFYKYVMVMAGRGFVNGKTIPVNGVGTFCPNATITRGEFITVIMRILYPENDYTANDGDPWWQDSYNVALQNSLILKEDKDLSGNIPISRQEMASIAYKALSLRMKAPEGYDITRVKDYDEVEERYKTSVYNTFNALLVQGDTEGYFHPKDNLTRAEASTVLYRLSYFLDEGSYVLT